MTKLKGARVLLTGALGFTGHHIRTVLTELGCLVVGLDARPGQDGVVADLLDKASVRAAVRQVAPTHVIHLAGIANVAHGDLMEFYRVNLFGTTNLLEALHEAALPIHRVVIASSANIYGNPEVPVVVETIPPAPVNHYAMSKLAMEYMARTWLDRLPIVFARPFNYTGTGQTEHFLIPKIVGHFQRRETVIRLGNLDVEREFNDVRMVACVYAGLLQRAVPGEAYNICTGRSYTMTQVFEMAKVITGFHMEIQVDPQLVRPNELKRLVGDPAKIRALIPELPDYRLHDTLTWMLGSENNTCG